MIIERVRHCRLGYGAKEISPAFRCWAFLPHKRTAEWSSAPSTKRERFSASCTRCSGSATHASSNTARCCSPSPPSAGDESWATASRSPSAAALAQDIDLITWTFDPLLSRNAHLNVAKLGATASSYLIDVYGAGSGLNAGLDTDRLFVEWRLSSPPGPGVVAGVERAVPVNAVTTDDRRLPCCASIDLSRRDPVLALQVPVDIGHLKATDLGLAIDWRRQTRRLFVHYFGLGYGVLDFRRPERSLPQYVLSRPTHLEDRL